MSRRLSFEACRDDGFTMVFVALLLVVLMAFAAFAIDLGMIMNERRQDQGAVDASAMSGGVIAVVGGDLQAVVDEVVSASVLNVGRAITDAQWVACTDNQALSSKTAAGLGLSPATPCISWSLGFDRMRVRLPVQVLPTTFARVIGFNSLSTRAFAEIQFTPLGGGGALPFVGLAGVAAGQHVCIRTSSSDNPPTQMVGNGPDLPATPGVAPVAADPCDAGVYDPASSTFGTLTPRDYLAGCDTQNDNVMEAIIQGTDHPTGFFNPPFTIPTGGTASAAESLRAATTGDVRVDGPGPQCTSFNPNTIKMNSGLSTSNLRCALISPSNRDDCPANGNDLVPRLKQGSNVASNIFVGENMDNTAAWAYLTSSSNLPTACTSLRSAHQGNDATWDFYDRRERFLACLVAWDPNTHDRLFTEAIGGSPRFAYVPQIAERRLCDDQDPPANCNPALDFAHVNSYVPIFLNKIYAKHGNNALGCEPLDPRTHSWYMHEAGQVYGVGCGPSNAAVDRLSAMVLDCRMLPKSICDPDLLPGNPGGTTSIFALRLSR